MQFLSASTDAQTEKRREVISGLLAQTLDAERLDENLWALIVTRVFGQQGPAIAWLQEDDLRLLGGLDASMCLARTILPDWRTRLICRPGERPIAYCDRWGFWLGPSVAADEPLAICAALLRAVLAVTQSRSRRRRLIPLTWWMGIVGATPHRLGLGILRRPRPWPLITASRTSA